MHDADPPPAAAPIAADPPKAAKVKRPAEQTKIKETVEQILIAFILAFIFRAYVVEAFVIPTGSMAPTLLGAHLRFRCPDCGYRFTVNYSAEGEGDDLMVPSTAVTRARDENGNVVEVPRKYSIHCPNCGYRLPLENPADPANAAEGPPVQYGDRILVLKYLYLLNDPARWDVVVFKNPSGRTDGRRQWFPDYTQNYIKRLVGLPGETLMLLDGDLYAARAKPGQDPKTLRPTDFAIQAKPYRAQQAVWRVAFDNDYQPTGQTRGAFLTADRLLPDPAWVDPWKQSGGTGWSLDRDGGRTFAFDGKGPGTLTFDPNADAIRNWSPRDGWDLPWMMTDWLAYDVTWNQTPLNPPDTHLTGGYTPDNAVANVSDVKLEFDYRRGSGDGPLEMVLTKGDHAFTATLLPGKVDLTMRVGTGAAVPIGSAAVDLGGTAHVEFINADYRVAVRVNGREVLASTPAQYAPDVAAKLAAMEARERPAKASVKLAASDQSAVLQHVRVMRDIYYNNVTLRGEPILWGNPHDFPNGLITLGPDDYWVLGDNSFISGDARVWSDPVNLPNENLVVGAGRVPGRFLLGKAFFVYWPAGYRPTGSLPALVPNFGDMRFIK